MSTSYSHWPGFAGSDLLDVQCSHSSESTQGFADETQSLLQRDQLSAIVMIHFLRV